MRTNKSISAALSACLFGLCQAAAASADDPAAKGQLAPDSGVSWTTASMAKAASARTIASRATASSAATVYGGFELATAATVYILVRGNSMGTLGVTTNFLDRPRLRLYNAAGQDLVNDNAGRPGFNFCSSTTDAAVINFYQGRGAPVSANDACIAANFAAGVFTFTVTPATVSNSGLTSSPASGEILFEVTLGP